MTQTTEQLTARVRELEEENARLKEIEQTNDTLLDQLGDKNAALLDEVASQKHCYAEAVAHYEKQLAASQAYVEQLRAALNTAAEKFHDYAELHSMKDRTRDNIEKTERNLDLARMCDKALALPRDTGALDAYVAEKVLHLQEEYADLCRMNDEATSLAKELTRQRDLAVSELETVANGFDCDNDAHRYGSYCRKCEANKALSIINGEVKE